MLFASGMAALVGVLMAKLSQGDNVVFTDECYHRSREFCDKHLSRFGVDDDHGQDGRLRRDGGRRHAAHADADQRVADQPAPELHRPGTLRRRSASGHGVETLIDATLATPYNLRPIDAGVDYVLHSCTKYLGGHNDLLAGSVAGLNREARGRPRPARHHGRDQPAAQRLPAAARPEDVRAADAAAQRERPGRSPGSSRSTRVSRRSTTRASSRTATTPTRSSTCGATAGW